MAIPYLKLTPVKKAGSPIGVKSGAGSHAAHHTGTRVSHGAGGRAAYLSGDRVKGPDGLVTDYRNKFGIEHAEVVLPGGSTCDREKLWNAVDVHKTQRPTADVAYDFIVAYPAELSPEERRKVAKDLAAWVADRYGVAVDYGMHLPETHKGSHERNYHGHYLISARKVSATGELGLVQRELNHRVCQQVDHSRGRDVRQKTAVMEIRDAWQAIANGALERGGHSERIDMASYARRGIDKTPRPTLDKFQVAELRAAKDAQQRSAMAHRTITVREARVELAVLERSLRERERAAIRRIAEINQGREIGIGGPVSDHVGPMEAWVNDTANQFIRAMASADRAARHRRTLREIEEAYKPMRAATAEESRDAMLAGRELRRVSKIIERVVTIADGLSAMAGTASLHVSANGTRDRLKQMEAEVSMRPGRSSNRAVEQELIA